MKENVKIAVVGLGRRGTGMIDKCFSGMKDVTIAMICDSYEPALRKMEECLAEKGYPAPIATTDFNDIINAPDIDAVVIMTGWREHTELAIKSMEAGKYTAIEVGCAYDISECYRLVETYERTGSPLMMLENCCYGRNEMMALNAVKQGLFGEIVHCTGGYMHYLPKEDLFKDIEKPYKHYRLPNYVSRNCENYPTHEFGPIAKVLGINRGNRVMTLSSFASKSVGLREAAKRHLGEDSPWATVNYKQGDIITTVLTCANGETVRLTLDTTLPRPYYSRDFGVRGTKGLYSEERHSFMLEGMSEPVANNEKEMYEKYDHPLQREYYALGTRGGHGGMDWLVCRAFIESVKRQIDTPIDAYDTAAWMAIGPLSEMSINRGGAPVDFPDFTCGKWMSREPAPRTKYCLD